MTRAIIAGLATAVPTYHIEQAAASEVATQFCCSTPQQESLLPALYRRTRIRRRGSVVLEGPQGSAHQRFFVPPSDALDDGPTTQTRMQRYAQDILPLALPSAQRALGDAHLDPARITHLITVSCTGFVAPGLDLGLIQALPLSPTVQRTHIGFMGCHAAINALRVGRALTAASEARVLICAVELCSLHFHYGWDPEQVVANALFADGAASVVLVPGVPDAKGWDVAATGSCVFPDSQDAITWRVGDHGFLMQLSARVPGLIQQHLPAWLSGWLREEGLASEGIASWAIHPGGPRILEAAAAGLGLAPEATAVSRAVFAEHGNMSSPTVLFILERLRQLGAPRPCVALGFGPGMAVEAALLR